MKDKTLLIMAAGMGSRFGGLKQIEPVGPNGEFIIDYSIYDAKQAGFTKVVFLIKEENYEIFKDTIGKRVEKQIETEYAFQKNDNLPEEYQELLKERTRPLGTAHAILCAKDKIHEPFAIINADDFYGRDAYQKASNYLDTIKENEYGLVAYRLGNTLTPNGSAKRGVCEVGFDLAKRFGFTFVGGHPMAGTQFSGIKHSRADLFNGASMIIVPPDFGDIALLDKIKHLLFPLQLGKITLSTAEHHDDVIAYTSQLAHIVSSAYIKNKNAENHVGFSAGSYKDMTRVATLNEKMWTELFLLNKDNLAGEIDELISSLSKYSKALKSGDEKALYALLSEGTARKCQLDG